MKHATLNEALPSSAEETMYIGEAPVSATSVNVLSLHWYAIKSRPSHEKKIAEHFESRSIEHYLPSYRTTRIWRNRCKMQLELPLFPGYLFARFDWCQRVRVLEIPSVVSIVGNGREPLPLQDSEIEALREGLHLRRTEPHPYLNIGERARIRSGPLAGFEGIVQRNNNGLRVVLTIQQIMKSIAVEVEACELESIGEMRRVAPSPLSLER